MTSELSSSAGRLDHARESAYKGRWYAVSIFFIAYLISIVDRQLLSILLVPIQSDLQVSDTLMSTLHGFTFAIFYSVMGLPIARMVDAGNRRLIIAVGILVWSIATAACGLASEFWHLLVARTLVAAGEAALLPGACSIIADLFAPNERGRAMGIFSSGATFGNSLSMLAGGVLFAAFSDIQVALPVFGTLQTWQLVFVAVGLPGIVVAALVLTTREPQRIARSGQIGVPIRTVIQYFSEHRFSYTFTIGGNSFYFAGMLAYLAWTPTLLIRNFGMDVGQAGTTYGIVLLIFGPVGTWLWGWLADWLQQSKGRSDSKVLCTMFACVGMIIPGIIYPLVDSYPMLISCLVTFVFFGSAPLGTAPASIVDMTPGAMRGQATALYTGILNIIGFGVGPLLVALLTDRFFEDPLLLRYSMVIVLLASMILALGCLGRNLAAYRAAVDAAERWNRT
jgi:MFS family permease